MALDTSEPSPLPGAVPFLDWGAHPSPPDFVLVSASFAVSPSFSPHVKCCYPP